MSIHLVPDSLLLTDSDQSSLRNHTKSSSEPLEDAQDDENPPLNDTYVKCGGHKK